MACHQRSMELLLVRCRRVYSLLVSLYPLQIKMFSSAANCGHDKMAVILSDRLHISCLTWPTEILRKLQISCCILYVAIWLQGSGPGTSSERTRTAITAALSKKLKDLMGDFQTLRSRLQQEYRSDLHVTWTPLLYLSIIPIA